MSDGGNRTTQDSAGGSALLTPGAAPCGSFTPVDHDPRLDSRFWPWNLFADLAEEHEWDDPRVLRVIVRELATIARNE